MGIHDYSVFLPGGWNLVIALHGNKFKHALNGEISGNGGASWKTR